MLLIVSFYHFTHYYNLVVYIPVYIGMSCSGLYIQYMKYKKDKLQINYDGVKT